MPTPTSAVLGKGIQLKRGDGASPEVFTLIPELADAPEAPASTAELVDVTNHDSGATREYIQGLADGNEITAVFNYYGHAQQTGLRTDFENQTTRNFQLVLTQLSPDQTAAFGAIVRNWTLNTPVDGPLQLSTTLKVTGTVTWT